MLIARSKECASSLSTAVSLSANEEWRSQLLTVKTDRWASSPGSSTPDGMRTCYSRTSREFALKLGTMSRRGSFLSPSLMAKAASFALLIKLGPAKSTGGAGDGAASTHGGAFPFAASSCLRQACKAVGSAACCAINCASGGGGAGLPGGGCSTPAMAGAAAAFPAAARLSPGAPGTLWGARSAVAGFTGGSGGQTRPNGG